MRHDTVTEIGDNAKIPVINALSDYEHPCQAITDFFTLEERFGSCEGLKFTYVGDGNNVCHSLMLCGALLGTHVTVATPKGYEPDLDIIHKAMSIAEQTGGSIQLMHDPVKAVAGADAVYTDVCISMGQEHETTRRTPIFKPYQVNEGLMAHASENAVFMHCLPAHRGGGGDGCCDGFAAVRRVRPGREPAARAEVHAADAAWRGKAHSSRSWDEWEAAQVIGVGRLCVGQSSLSHTMSDDPRRRYTER